MRLEGVLWVRTQDKKALIPINKMITNTCEGLFYDGIILGVYETEKRALEILDEMETTMFCKQTNLYKMPEK